MNHTQSLEIVNDKPMFGDLLSVSWYQPIEAPWEKKTVELERIRAYSLKPMTYTEHNEIINKSQERFKSIAKALVFVFYSTLTSIVFFMPDIDSSHLIQNIKFNWVGCYIIGTAYLALLLLTIHFSFIKKEYRNLIKRNTDIDTTTNLRNPIALYEECDYRNAYNTIKMLDEHQEILMLLNEVYKKRNSKLLEIDLMQIKLLTEK